MSVTSGSVNFPENSAKPRKFRLWLYLLIITVLSWAFLLPVGLIPFNDAWITTLLGGIAMLMVALGTFISGRWVFRDGFDTIGWRWGSARSWAIALGLPLLIFLLPTILDIIFGSRTYGPLTPKILSLTLVVIILGPIFGFGEEFGFRGYLLPRLWWLGPRKALIVAAIIYVVWHYPVSIIPLVINSINAGQLNLLTLATNIIAGLILTGSIAIILSYVWVSSGSIVVASVFHGWFDAVRNITMYYIFIVNINPITQAYYPLFIVILGGLLLWRYKWVLPEPLHLTALPVDKKTNYTERIDHK